MLQSQDESYKAKTRATKPRRELQSHDESCKAKTRATKPRQELQNQDESYKAKTRATKPRRELQSQDESYSVSKSKRLKSKSLGACKPIGRNSIATIVYGHVFLREEICFSFGTRYKRVLC
jgi:hypothetical protein